MISLKNVSFSYGEKQVLRNFSLQLPHSGIVALHGPSGCGKTTVTRLLLGLLKPQSGEIAGDRSLPSVVFQEDRLLPWETVLSNVSLSSGNRAAAEELLRAVGLDQTTFQKLPRELSGGMRRRAAIARALAAESRWLVLDEPFSGVDAENRDRIAALILEYAKDKPVVLVTHQPEEMELLGARIVVMD